VGRVYTSQQAFFTEDAARDDPSYADNYRVYGATAVLAVPITVGITKLGVLAVYGARPSIFAVDDVQLMRLLADQIGVVLDTQSLAADAAHGRGRGEAPRLKDDFLSAAAHDLKTPLTALLIQAQLMERRARHEPSSPADLSSLQRLVHEAQRLRQF